MTEIKKPNRQNIFESDIIQDLFVLDILEKIAYDWKRAYGVKTYNRENFEEFVTNDFMQWIELGIGSFCDEEFGFDECEGGKQE